MLELNLLNKVVDAVVRAGAQSPAAKPQLRIYVTRSTYNQLRREALSARQEDLPHDWQHALTDPYHPEPSIMGYPLFVAGRTWTKAPEHEPFKVVEEL